MGRFAVMALAEPLNEPNNRIFIRGCLGCPDVWMPDGDADGETAAAMSLVTGCAGASPVECRSGVGPWRRLPLEHGCRGTRR